MDKNNLLNINLILSYLPPETDSVTADLGCGNFGHLVFPLAKLVGRRGLVYAVDVQKSCLEEIDHKIKVENWSQVKTVWSDLEVLNATAIPAGSLDSALIVTTLNQADDKVAMISEARRLLKKGGRLVLVDWKQDSDYILSVSGKGLDAKEMENLFLSIGFTKLDEFIPGDYYFGLVFIKK